MYVTAVDPRAKRRVETDRGYLRVITAGVGEGLMLLQMYAITAIILALKMAAISIVQGRARTKAGVFTNPEDAKAFGGQQASAEVPMVERANRAWRNDLENIPIFLILAWIYVSAGLAPLAFVIYCVVFMIARVIHTTCYLNAIQPWRTIAFTIGSLAMLAMIIQLFVNVVV
jgi:glutathione S-transferase